MEYFFVLGNNPTLSIAELSAVFSLNKNNKKIIFASDKIIVLRLDQKINAKSLIKKMGGIIKIGVIEKTIDTKPGAKNILNLISLNKIIGKFKFGISYYADQKINIKPLALEVKKALKEKGISCRWVESRKPVLSSVIVEQNKLIQKGIDIVLIEASSEKNLLIGKTLAVQPFKELSYRDYGRPCRDDASGMIPPKLAQIMINLSGLGSSEINFENKTILDPFCGSGTILTEAMLMGCKNLIGSDISKKAIADTKENIKWTKNNFQFSMINVQLLNQSAAKLSKFIKAHSIDAIVTEPYLGPQRGKFNLKKTVEELEKLYTDALREFKRILKPNGQVVMVWPVFNLENNNFRNKFVNPNLGGFKIINPIPETLRYSKFIQLSKKGTVIYGREGQRIFREIVMFDLLS